ncbi:MAG TPA: hypothetical protein VGM93_02800, partial [Acidimicrobiales bacterium]
RRPPVSGWLVFGIMVVVLLLAGPMLVTATWKWLRLDATGHAAAEIRAAKADPIWDHVPHGTLEPGWSASPAQHEWVPWHRASSDVERGFHSRAPLAAVIGAWRTAAARSGWAPAQVTCHPATGEASASFTKDVTGRPAALTVHTERRGSYGVDIAVGPDPERTFPAGLQTVPSIDPAGDRLTTPPGTLPTPPCVIGFWQDYAIAHADVLVQRGARILVGPSAASDVLDAAERDGLRITAIQEALVVDNGPFAGSAAGYRDGGRTYAVPGRRVRFAPTEAAAAAARKAQGLLAGAWLASPARPGPQLPVGVAARFMVEFSFTDASG